MWNFLYILKIYIFRKGFKKTIYNKTIYIYIYIWIFCVHLFFNLTFKYKFFKIKIVNLSI